VSARFVSSPISLAGIDAGFHRADLVFYGLDHSGPSYEVRIFFNRPDATADTPRSADQGYVRSFYLFGHGGCAGQPGHCDVPDSRRPFDFRPQHQLTPATRWVTVTDAARGALAAGRELTVTIVPVVTSPGAKPDEGADVMGLERVSLVTYD
jgi:tyrosinase